MKILLVTFLSCFYLAAYSQENNPGLTAVFDSRKNTVKIKWLNNNSQVTKYVLQRSSDNRTWADIYTLFITDANKNRFLSYADDHVVQGKSYYRLQSFRGNTSATSSSPIMVIIGKPGNNWLMYPVPVGNVINLQYNGSQLIPGVITVHIQNVSSGQLFHKLRFASTTRLIQIPVSNLGRGVYDIRIYIRNEIVWNQRFVK